MTTQNLILPPGWNKQTIESVTGPGARFEKPAGKIQTLPCWVLSDLELAELLCKAYNQGTGVTTLQSATSSAEREAFEAWLTDFDRGPDLTIDQEGFYDDHGVQRPWSAWQACARLKTASEADAKDAARYRWLRDQQPNSLSLSRNEGNSVNHMTVKRWVEEYVPDQYADVPADELQRMKDADTDWALQIYPRSPVSFDVWHAATLDAVIDAARAAEGEV